MTNDMKLYSLQFINCNKLGISRWGQFHCCQLQTQLWKERNTQRPSLRSMTLLTSAFIVNCTTMAGSTATRQPEGMIKLWLFHIMAITHKKTISALSHEGHIVKAMASATLSWISSICASASRWWNVMLSNEKSHHMAKNVPPQWPAGCAVAVLQCGTWDAFLM